MTPLPRCLYTARRGHRGGESQAGALYEGGVYPDSAGAASGPTPPGQLLRHVVSSAGTFVISTSTVTAFIFFLYLLALYAVGTVCGTKGLLRVCCPLRLRGYWDLGRRRGHRFLD